MDYTDCSHYECFAKIFKSISLVLFLSTRSFKLLVFPVLGHRLIVVFFHWIWFVFFFHFSLFFVVSSKWSLSKLEFFLIQSTKTTRKVHKWKRFLISLISGRFGDIVLVKKYIYTIKYYSAIKRNAFESVLMRWMNLEHILQSEVSQKEKYKYCILMHIYGI